MAEVKGGLILQKRARAISAEATWKDASGYGAGVIEWTVTNTGTDTASFILIRGASLGGVEVMPPYPFAEAYGFLYAYNGSLFGTGWEQGTPVPLVDKGVANNAPLICAVKSPGETFMAFNFCLSPGQSYSMLEGGWTGGVTPSGIEMIQIAYEDTEQWCVQYDPQQCAGYNSQTGSNLPCPPNPYGFTASTFSCAANPALVFPDDAWTPGPCPSGTPPSCLQMIQQGIANNNMQEVLAGLQCLMEQEFLSVFDVIETALKAVKSKV